MCFLAHLVYQPKSLFNHELSIIIIGIVLHQHRHLCTLPHGTWLDIELHIWYTYAHMPTTYAHQIFNDSDV